MSHSHLDLQCFQIQLCWLSICIFEDGSQKITICNKSTDFLFRQGQLTLSRQWQDLTEICICQIACSGDLQVTMATRVVINHAQI